MNRLIGLAPKFKWWIQTVLTKRNHCFPTEPPSFLRYAWPNWKNNATFVPGPQKVSIVNVALFLCFGHFLPVYLAFFIKNNNLSKIELFCNLPLISPAKHAQIVKIRLLLKTFRGQGIKGALFYQFELVLRWKQGGCLGKTAVRWKRSSCSNSPMEHKNKSK